MSTKMVSGVRFCSSCRSLSPRSEVTIEMLWGICSFSIIHFWHIVVTLCSFNHLPNMTLRLVILLATQTLLVLLVSYFKYCFLGHSKDKECLED
ncbi:unnamed protein product [Allacma fusca]|uniref:Uncharacterized protein n=1 Tax=Allacma fusca TaxID=39272 RepID=A0A8J2J1T8_9HEXA|nr:unnamed protein product [Allacma fusca]